METKFVITIGRQFGSGGREIGRIIAEKLGIKYYDKELLAAAAESSGVKTEFFEESFCFTGHKIGTADNFSVLEFFICIHM